MNAKHDLELVSIPFGKHRGTPLSEVPVGYVQWMLDNSDHHWVGDNRDLLVERLTYVPAAARPTLQLAADQTQALGEIEHSFLTLGHKVHNLAGAAGYGKSYVCQAVTLKLKDAGYVVRAAATSYVASQNLAKDLEPLGVEVSTIARLLRLTVRYEGPKEIYEPSLESIELLPSLLGRDQALIIDEYSMVDDTVGKLLLDAAHRFGDLLLVVGDAGQLPSPAQNWDSLLTTVEPRSELTIPKRYSVDSDLYRVERQARITGGMRQEDFTNSDEVTLVRSLDDMYGAYTDSYRAHPDEDHLMLFYRRADMTAANRILRSRLFPGDEDVMKGERLRVQRTSNYNPIISDEIRVYSGTTMTVVSAEPVTKTVVLAGGRYDIPCWRVEVEEQSVPLDILFSITENAAEGGTRGADEFNSAISETATWCKDNNDWAPYRILRNSFVQVTYRYASTVHRVQGQSVDRIFVSPAMLSRADPWTARKLRYVGLTRAKRHLTVL